MFKTWIWWLKTWIWLYNVWILWIIEFDDLIWFGKKIVVLKYANIIYNIHYFHYFLFDSPNVWYASLLREFRVRSHPSCITWKWDNTLLRLPSSVKRCFISLFLFNDIKCIAKKVWNTLEDSSSKLCFLKLRYDFVIIIIISKTNHYSCLTT